MVIKYIISVTFIILQVQQGKKCKSMFIEWIYCLICYRYIITAILVTLALKKIH